MQFLQGKHQRILAAAATAVVTVSGIAYAAKRPKAPTPPGVTSNAGQGTPAALGSAQNDDGSAPTLTEKKAAAQAAADAPKPKVQVYTVAEGDSIEAIAAKFSLKAATVLWANDLAEADLLKVGQELTVPSVDGIVHKVAEGDTLWDIALDHNADMDAIIKANPDVSPDALHPDVVLVVPGGQPAVRRQVASRSAGETTRESAPAPRPSGGGGFRWPTVNLITDTFGWRIHPVYGTRNFHDGIDINAPTGTPVAAAKSGTVTMSGWYGGYGIAVKLDHGDGTGSLYGHLSKAAVTNGQHVEAGQLIGYSGSTGASTGAHLHFTIYVGGNPVDPMNYLP